LNAERAAAFAPKALPASAKASARSRRSSPELSANDGGRRAAPELVENNPEWRREIAEDRVVLIKGILCGLRGLCVDRLKV
jgi:hypothetical protein